jgi:hypothetical protein
MARQGHWFITNLSVRVVRTKQQEHALIDVPKDGTEIGDVVFFGTICVKEYF